MCTAAAPADELDLLQALMRSLAATEYRARAEEILVGAARAGADLRALAAICAEIRPRNDHSR